MTLTLKDKLHDYIERADEKKLQAIYTLIESDLEHRSSLYDEGTLAALKQTSEDYRAGKIKGYSVEESMARVRQQIARR